MRSQKVGDPAPVGMYPPIGWLPQKFLEIGNLLKVIGWLLETGNRKLETENWKQAIKNKKLGENHLLVIGN